jgi:molybdenum cofactor cytidylyltransferase
MTAIIILAAGASKRLGQPKQTLEYNTKSLLKRSIEAAVGFRAGPVIVVIGANEQAIQAHVQNEGVTIVINKDWEEGIASSIRAGVKSLNQNPEVENVILMVCDQPFVDTSILNQLLNAKKSTGKPIVACAYKQTVGVPALFDKLLFPELMKLEGEHGGKKVILEHQDLMAPIPFEKGEIDIDAAEDVEALTGLGNS